MRRAECKAHALSALACNAFAGIREKSYSNANRPAPESVTITLSIDVYSPIGFLKFGMMAAIEREAARDAIKAEREAWLPILERWAVELDREIALDVAYSAVRKQSFGQGST